MKKSNQSMSSNSSRQRKREKSKLVLKVVKILWDFENLWFIEGENGADSLSDFITSIMQNIRKALKDYNVDFEEIDVVGYGPFKGSNRLLVQSLIANGCKFHHVPRRTVTCDGNDCTAIIREADPRHPDHPYDLKTDLADVELVREMFLHVIDNGIPCGLLVISNDSDFTASIKELVNDNCIVMSAIDENANPERCLAGTDTWEWSKLKKGQPPIENMKSYLKTRKS